MEWGPWPKQSEKSLAAYALPAVGDLVQLESPTAARCWLRVIANRGP